MLWILKRTVSDGSFEHPKYTFKLMGEKIFTILQYRLPTYLSREPGKRQLLWMEGKGVRAGTINRNIG